MFGAGPLPAFGVAGAAWSLVTCFGCGSAFLLGYLLFRAPVLNLSLAALRWRGALLMEFVRVGVPGMVNVVINNVTVVVLTALAARIGGAAAVGYALGARLEYVVIPLGFGIGTAILALVGTNYGARQLARSRRAAFSGALLAAAFCGATGLLFAAFPSLWTGIFTTDAAISRIASTYLRIVGPAYALYGFAIGFYFACQGCGRLARAVAGNLVRLLVAAGGTLLAVQWLDAGPAGMFVAIAAGFAVHAALTAWAFVHAVASWRDKITK
jgi:Na+-driven multidrug efflux pump